LSVVTKWAARDIDCGLWRKKSENCMRCCCWWWCWWHDDCILNITIINRSHAVAQAVNSQPPITEADFKQCRLVWYLW